jgi:ariadne-1
MCPVCYDETDEWFSVEECGHILCKDCFTEYLTEQMNKGVACVSATCPFDGCGFIMPDTLYEELLIPEVYKKFQHLCTLAFVDLSPDRDWCPGAECDMFVEKSPNKKVLDVDCKNCHHSFCFECDWSSGHAPLTCDEI